MVRPVEYPREEFTERLEDDRLYYGSVARSGDGRTAVSDGGDVAIRSEESDAERRQLETEKTREEADGDADLADVDLAPPSAQEDGPTGVDRWKQETKGIERVIDVMMTVEESQTAGWIAEQAHVSEQTGREHLQMFADLGVISATTVSGVTKYQPDPAWIRFQELAQLTEGYDRDELLDQVEQLKERIESAESQFGVESPDEIRAKAADDDTTVDEVKEYRTAAAEWESAIHDLQIRRQALDRYDEFSQSAVTA